MMRACTKCGVVKNPDEFYGRKWNPPRNRGPCKLCDAERMKRNHEQNRDDRNKRARHRYRPRQRNPRQRVDTTNAKSRQWRIDNPVESKQILEHFRAMSIEVLRKRGEC